MARTKDMTQGSPTRLILLFSLPIIAGNALQQLYSLVDSLIIGRLEGVTALAAVSGSGWLDWTVLSVAMGLAQGFAIQAAQDFGAGDLPGLRRTAGQSVLISAAAVALIEVVSQLLLTPVLTLMNTPVNTKPLTTLYLRIVFGGLPLVMAVNVLAGFLRSVGDSRTPLAAMTCATVCNIALDVLFVGAARMGVAGAALATVTAQGVSCLICAVAVKRLPILHPARQDLKPDGAKIRRLMKLGSPIAFQNLVISVGGLVLQTVVNGFGFIFMAGYSAASRLQGLIELAGSSLGSAVGTFAGQNYGAGRLDRVREGLNRSAVVGVMMALAVAAAMLLFGRGLLEQFVRDETLPVGEVLTYGYRFLSVMSAGLFMLYLLFVYRSTLQGLGNTVVPMVSGFVELAMRIGAVLLLPRLVGEWGVYSAEILAWIGAAVFLMAGYYRHMRRLEVR